MMLFFPTLIILTIILFFYSHACKTSAFNHAAQYLEGQMAYAIHMLSVTHQELLEKNFQTFQVPMMKEAAARAIRKRFADFPLNQTGCLLIHPGNNTPMLPFGAETQTPPQFQILDQDDSAFPVLFTDPSGRDNLYLIRTVPGTDWKVLLIYRTAELMKESQANLSSFSLLFLLILFCAALFSWHTARLHEKASRDLLRCIESIHAGTPFPNIPSSSFLSEYQQISQSLYLLHQEILDKEQQLKNIQENQWQTRTLEAIGKLAANLAHDFNNILTTIQGNLQLAILFSSSREVTQYLEDCEKGTDRAQNFVRQLLTFAKGGVPRKTVLNIPELIQNEAALILSGSRCSFRMDFQENLPAVDADPVQLQQALDNLLINASQSMKSGGIVDISLKTVRIHTLLPGQRSSCSLESFSGVEPCLENSGEKARKLLQPGHYLEISIQDSGCGIPPEALHQIFNPFYTTKPSGTGLGLPSTLSIVQKHAGFLHVASEPGKGSIFRIYLPASPKHPASIFKPEVHSETKNLYTGGGRILVMDDQKSVRDLLGRMLTIMHCHVDFAEDGKDMIEKFLRAREQGIHYDILIMDLLVPSGMGGKEAVRIIRETDPSVCAVAASGYSDDPVMADCTAYGFSDKIAKPFRMRELSLLIRSLMEKKGWSPKEKRNSQEKESCLYNPFSAAGKNTTDEGKEKRFFRISPAPLSGGSSPGRK